MSPLLKKETRMLLVPWLAALAVATTPLWFWRELNQLISVVFCASILGLSLSSFGQETTCGTFGLLLVQPKDRRRLWGIKAGLLAGGLILVWMVFALAVIKSYPRRGPEELRAWLVVSALVTALAFSGGLWSTLLVRDVVSAFFCCCLAPIIIFGLTTVILGSWISSESETFTRIIVVLAVLYSIAGFVWARWLFLNAQDTAWTGGNISMGAGGRTWLNPLALLFTGRTNAWAALIKKELQLQGVMMFVIPILGILHLAALAAHHFAPKRFPGDLARLIVPIICGSIVPFLIGCAAVANERQFNTLEASLCLPVSKRAQFLVKLIVALTLGMLLGGMIPAALIRFGGDKHDFLGWQYLLEFSAVVTGTAFYASTMSRSMIQAIPITLCIYMVQSPVALLGAWLKHGLPPEQLSFTWKAMAIVFVGLAYKNYKTLQTGARLWLKNLVWAEICFGGLLLLSIALYQRPWEYFMSLEPRHGSARINGAGQTDISVREGVVYAVLPDGRLWMGRMDGEWKTVSGKFCGKLGWSHVVADTEGAIALKSDGTLWKIPFNSEPKQIGDDADWKKIIGTWSAIIALKGDGTLWERNYKDIGFRAPGQDRSSTFVQVGNNSDWSNIFSPSGEGATGVQADGSVWNLSGSHILRDGEPAKPSLYTKTYYPRLQGADWRSLARIEGLHLGIRSDGTLWAIGKLPEKIFGNWFLPRLQESPVQVGLKSDWVGLSGDGLRCVAVEGGGAYWAIQAGKSWQPSKYSDWLAAREEEGATFALAKDGTLCCWKTPDYYREMFSPSTLLGTSFLGPTRRPLFSVNILDGRN